MKDLAARINSAALLLVVALLLSAGPVRAQTDAASLFNSKCGDCHGADGSGKTAVGKSLNLRDLRSAEVQKQTDEELTGITANGTGGMPAYKDRLTGDQIKQLVSYMRSLAKKNKKK
ncbi:MAG: cytochrome c [Candidatus Acidiferrales bacterium]|jgi:mono/diheme cytochrome c family protein